MRVVGRWPLAGVVVGWGLVVSMLGLAGPATAAPQALAGSVGGWVGVNSTHQGTPLPRAGLAITFYRKSATGAWSAAKTARTNSGGNYSLTLAPGKYKARFHDDYDAAVESSWYDGPATGGFVADGSPYVQRATVLDVRSGQAIKRVSAGLEDGNLMAPTPVEDEELGTILGFVDTDKARMGNVFIDLYRSEDPTNQPWITTSVEDSGSPGAVQRWDFQVPPGRYTLRFHGAEIATEWWRDAATRTDSTVLDVTSGGEISVAANVG